MDNTENYEIVLEWLIQRHLPKFENKSCKVVHCPLCYGLSLRRGYKKLMDKLNEEK